MIPERMAETLAELPFIGDQVVCFGHDQAARSLESMLVCDFSNRF